MPTFSQRTTHPPSTSSIPATGSNAQQEAHLDDDSRTVMAGDYGRRVPLHTSLQLVPAERMSILGWIQASFNVEQAYLYTHAGEHSIPYGTTADLDGSDQAIRISSERTRRLRILEELVQKIPVHRFRVLMEALDLRVRRGKKTRHLTALHRLQRFFDWITRNKRTGNTTR